MEKYLGRGKQGEEKELLEMLDDVFFSDDNPETQRDFLSLLPKLYKSKYNPCHNNMCMYEDGKIKAAIGFYPSYLNVAGHRLKVCGVGNVGVSKDVRRKGYMIDCLNKCIEEMKADETDYSVLGGQRQRYGFFGYEPAGVEYNISINRGNYDRLFGKEYQPEMTLNLVEENETEILEKCNLLYKRLPIYADRNIDELYDILCSWDSRPYKFMKNGEFKGYCALHKYGGIQEIFMENTEDILEALNCVMNFQNRNEISLSLPLCDIETADHLSKHCSSVEINHSEMLLILNFRNFIKAFLGLKALRTNLPSGTFVLLIRGLSGDENLEITVDGKSVSVENTEKKPDLELDLHDAERLVASLCSKYRDNLPWNIAPWFPVDFSTYSQDNV